MPRTRRLLLVCHYLHHVVGGAEIIGHKVLAGLRHAGWTVHSAVLPGPHPAPADRRIQWHLPFGLQPGTLRGKQIAIYAGDLGIDASATRQIRHQLDPDGYDAVVAHDTVSLGVARRLARFLQRPLIAFVYEPLPRANPAQGGLQGWILGLLTRRANRVVLQGLQAAAVRIAASGDTASRLERFAPGPPTRVVYNSAPIPTAVPTSGVGMLFVGRLSREKGFDLLAEAYRMARNRPPLSIAGLDGPLAHEARRLAADHASVRLLEPVRPNAMEAVYVRHSTVVAPSTWPDPLPGAVLEARAFGRALLVSNQGGIPEIVQGYRPLRVVDVTRPRPEAVAALSDAITTLPDWAAINPDPDEESRFRTRHSLGSQMEGIGEAIRMATDCPPTGRAC